MNHGGAGIRYEMETAAPGLEPGAVVAVVVNPTARRWRPAHEALVRELLSRDFAPRIVRTAGRAETRRVARTQALEGARAVIVAGGDGTVNTAVNGLRGLATPIGLLPLGTANDLARALELPLAPAAAARRLHDGRIRAIDLPEVNGERFVTVGGVGLAADVALAVNRLRRRRGLARIARPLGTALYALAAAACIARGPRRDRLRLTYVDAAGRPRVWEDAVATLLVGNQGSLGGMALPTGAVDDDGLVEVLAVPAAPRGRLLRTLVALWRGRMPERDMLAVHRARTLRIDCPVPGWFFGDGEALAYGRRFTVETHPRALAVIC